MVTKTLYYIKRDLGLFNVKRPSITLLFAFGVILNLATLEEKFVTLQDKQFANYKFKQFVRCTHLQVKDVQTEQIQIHPNYCSASFESLEFGHSRLLLVLRDVSIVTISAGEQRRRFSILDFQIRSEKTPIMKKLCDAKVQALVD